VHQRLDVRPPADEERADSLGRAELVARDGEKVELLRLGVDPDLPERLDSVGVDHHAALFRFCGEFGHGLNRADFVVHPHHRANGDLLVD